MRMIPRLATDILRAYVDFDKAIIVKGARQVGKTTLIRHILKDVPRVLWIDGDDPETRSIWTDISKARIQFLIAPVDYIVIDEAQRIGNIGLAVKMILDMKSNKQVILSGSSSLNLASSINEPLTGRKWNIDLFPLSWAEIVQHYQPMGALQLLEKILVLGTYPEVFESTDKTEQRLLTLASSYLYKDVLEYGDIRKPELLVKLLRALAYQVGSEVSYLELARMLQVNHETIQRYIALLEDSYVIFRLPPLSTNPRKEISTSRKIYFYDNGIRNALINNLQPLAVRNDVGALWENFIISEFRKRNSYNDLRQTHYFWRSKAQSEVDLVVETNSEWEAFEIKYNPRKATRLPPLFTDTYHPLAENCIHRDNFYQFI